MPISASEYQYIDGKMTEVANVLVKVTNGDAGMGPVDAYLEIHRIREDMAKHHLGTHWLRLLSRLGILLASAPDRRR